MKRLTAECEMAIELLDACYEKLKSEPNNMEIIILRGILHSVVHSYDKAITDLNKVINNLPDDERCYYLRSDCHFNKGEYDIAKRDYLRALKIQFKDDSEFVDGYTEKTISEATISSKSELKKIKKILDYEKKRVLLSFIPQLEN